MSELKLQEIACGAANVAVVVVNYRTPDLALRCLEAVEKERRALPLLRLIIVDGFSNDGSAEKIRMAICDPRYASWVTLLALPINGGFGWANNQAILKLLAGGLTPKFIHLLNPDTAVEPHAIEALVRLLLERPDAAAAGSQLLEEDGSESGSAFVFPTLLGEFARGARTGLVESLLRIKREGLALREARDVDWVTGASVMLRTTALQQAGLFDDGFFLYHEEIELMWRLRACGWQIVHEPASRVLHAGGAATGVNVRPTKGPIIPRRPAYWYESRRRFFARSRGPLSVPLALGMWTAGYGFFRLRRALGLAPGSKLLEHELSDQWKYGRSRPSDRGGAIVFPGSSERARPAWMKTGT